MLHAATTGVGPGLVALHGWGTHSVVWTETVAALATTHAVTAIDLPGFGRSRAAGAMRTLPQMAESVVAASPANAVWLGWSLGGMVALQAASLHPEMIRALVLVATTPRFVQGPEWPHALPAHVLAQFADDLTTDYRAAVQRFVVLQAGRGEGARAVAKRLRRDLFRYGEPSPEALAGGLRILRDTDLRSLCAVVACPGLAILGARDTLVPSAVGAELQRLCPGWMIHIVPGSGHAPFLSHQAQFLSLLTTFLDGLDQR